MSEITESGKTPELVESSATAAARVPNQTRISHSRPTGSSSHGDTEIDHAYFTFSVLQDATEYFCSNNLIKKGSTADIFKGKIEPMNIYTGGNLQHNKAIAVKRLKSPLGKREEDYARELDIRIRVRHPNIIKLIGSCSHEDERIIVFELPSDLKDLQDLHTLHDNLFDGRHQLLDWQTRMNIAASVANGLNYLHNEVGVFYSDLSMSCVILDDSLRPRILDIGIEKFCSREDIYRFGLFLFEIITGKKARDYSLWHCWYSVDTRVKKILNNGREITVADPKIRQQLPPFKLHKALILVSHCLSLNFDVNVSPSYYRQVDHAMQYIISADPTEPWPITSHSYSTGLPLNNIRKAYNLSVFSIKEIEDAVLNVPEEQRFQNGFVHKGMLNGKVVAIKFLSNRIVSVYETNVRLLSRLSHPNIIKLLGYCGEGVEKILVYEFMPNFSLYDQLQDYEMERGSLNNGEKVLSWDKRMQIVKDVAKALNYLHYEAKPPIIYGDLKPSNILLDASFNAKLSDFGSAQASLRANTTSSSTSLYWSPERTIFRRLSVKSDVYNFGMILFEMLIGKYSTLNELKGKSEDGIFELVKQEQPMLVENINPDILMKAIKVGSMCVSNLDLRPNMQTVVRAMEYLTYDRRIVKSRPPEWPSSLKFESDETRCRGA